jgi:hypothetical protein
MTVPCGTEVISPFRIAAGSPASRLLRGIRAEGLYIRAKRSGFILAGEACFGIGAFELQSEDLLVEVRHGFAGSGIPKAGEAGVPNDCEQPSSAVTAAETIEKPRRAEISFLYGIFGVVMVPHQPA